MTCVGAAGFCEQESVQVAALHRHQEALRPEAAHLQVPITYVLPVPVQRCRTSVSVSDPYSLNPDPAKIMNPYPVPSYFFKYLKKIQNFFIIFRFSHQKKSIEL